MKKTIILFIILLFTGMIFSKDVFTYQDIFKYQKITSLKISPNSTFIVFTKRMADKKKNSWISQVFYSDLNFKNVIQLTRKANNFSPQISPDSKRIAFVSTRDKKSQIYVITLPGGDPKKISDYKEGIRDFKWLDNNRIVFSAREMKGFIEKKRKKDKDDAIDVESLKEFYPVRLFCLNINTGDIKRITFNKTRITEFEISPDKKRIITSEIDSPKFSIDAKYYMKYFIYNISNSKSERIFKNDKFFQPYSFNWIKSDVILMKENKSNYEEKRGPGYPLLYAYFVKDKRLKRINLNWDWGLGGLYSKSIYFRNNKIFTILAKGVWNYPVVLKVDNKLNVKKRKIIKTGIFKNIDYFTITKNGRKLFFIASKPDFPHRVYSANISKSGNFINPKELYLINDWTKNKNFGKREILHWKSKDNRDVEGILIYPVNYNPNKKYPLVLTFHGGPYAYTKDGFINSWAYYPQALAGDGFFTLFVNYWGGSNYGLKFAESIVGKYYELEIPDILSGMKYVFKHYSIDEKKVGVMGWSNGAILSIGCILKRDFAFAIPGAGDVNWISDWGNCAFGVQFDNLYFGKPYYEDIQLYIKKSPLFKLKKVNTPVLIFFGTNDTNVPTEQGWEFYRTMEQLGKEVKFVLMPGEPHSFRKLSHQKRKVLEEVKWIHKHLNIEKETCFKLMKKDSRINKLIKLQKLKRINGIFGEKVKGIIIPEFIKFKNLMVSRTEFTRGQLNEFYKEKYPDKVYKSDLNLPVINLDKKIINEYIDYVYKKIGKRLRLIKSSEFNELVKSEKSSKENVLSYWIGYKPNPDEKNEWIKYLKKNKLFEKMVLPVASLFPTKSGFYDLNGNLSELSFEGKVLGNWFMSVKDTKEIKCREHYYGIRFVIERGK